MDDDKFETDEAGHTFRKCSECGGYTINVWTGYCGDFCAKKALRREIAKDAKTHADERDTKESQKETKP